MVIYKKYFFETAHYMPGFPKKHKYSKIHGHSYEMVIYIEGNVEKKHGWVFNFEKLDKLILPLINIIDHNLLNEITDLEFPTSENIAKWFWNKLIKDISQLRKIEIIRPRIGGCVYEGK